MNRQYQFNYASVSSEMYNLTGRERKAKTMVAVLKDFSKKPLNELKLLNIGGSTGIIDNYLSDYFLSVLGIDIDSAAINYAKSNFQKPNLNFEIGDAVNLRFPDNSFDVVICSQVYEHVPSPELMISEIFRVLAPGGVCYFAATNRLMWNEPHYKLPLLSVIPRPLAHLYVRFFRIADHYHELHYTYWGLKKLVSHFLIHDYTQKVISNPVKFHVDYMISPKSLKAFAARHIAGKLPWFTPGYIWLLEKPLYQGL
jgi:2-polyprenyl-3-methyl-5-hydroxy-6-metoxy-1,4-benzoquinol methylase